MIPTDLYGDYTTALVENDRQARSALAAIMTRLAPADADGIRDALLEVYPALVKLYGMRAAQVALEFYAGVREAQGVATRFVPELPGESEIYDEPEAVADVRREVGKLYSGKSTLESLTSTMQGLATKRTIGMADSTLMQLAAADPAKPKWAFVPHPGACGWCVMIGSRGFGYSREKAADDMRHDHCLCTVVADFDLKNPGLEGYDPDAMGDAYLRCREAVEEDARRRWRDMGAEERARYTRKGSDKPSYDAYLRNRIVGEMNMRDRGWLHSGRKVPVDDSAFDMAKLNDSQLHVYRKERRAASVLSDNGFAVRMTDNPLAKQRRGMPSFDYSIGEDGRKWEAKCPEGSGYLAVAGNIAKADAKFKKVGERSRIVLSNLDSEMTDDAFLSHFKESLRDPQSDFSNVYDVLLVMKGGYVRHYRP